MKEHLQLNTMPRRKEEFKPLTFGHIISINPQRAELSGDKKEFKNLIVKSTKQEPFDKKRD